MPKFRAKPVEIFAIQVQPGNLRKICDFLGGEKRRNLDFSINYSTGRVALLPFTGARGQVAQPGDWIAKGARGEFFTMADSDLPVMYERV